MTLTEHAARRSSADKGRRVFRPGHMSCDPDLHVFIFAPLPCSPDQARCLVHRDTWSGRWFLLPISLIASGAATQKNGTVGTT